MTAKIISHLMFVILLSMIVVSDCHKLNIESKFNLDQKDCVSLDRIIIVDSCQLLPPPPNCWQPYQTLVLNSSKNIAVSQEKIKLNSHYVSYDIDITCTSPKKSWIKLTFDDECERIIELDLREEKAKEIEKIQELSTEPVLATQSPTLVASNPENSKAAENEAEEKQVIPPALTETDESFPVLVLLTVLVGLVSLGTIIFYKKRNFNQN